MNLKICYGRQGRRRRASVGVVNDVARLETAGATSRRCVDRVGNARRDTAASQKHPASLVSSGPRRQYPS